jgi:hypothetical protein
MPRQLLPKPGKPGTFVRNNLGEKMRARELS